MTLDDLERIAHYALGFKICASFGAHHGTFNEDRSVLHGYTCVNYTFITIVVTDTKINDLG